MATFSIIPSTLRRPGAYTEVDSSRAGSGATGVHRTLIIAQKLAAGTAQADVATRCFPGEEYTLGGRASVLQRAATAWNRRWRREFATRTVWGQVLQAALMRPRWSAPVTRVLDRVPAAAHWFAKVTRGGG